MLNPPEVDRDEVTPPENVAVTLSGTLIMTMPEPPFGPFVAPTRFPPAPPPVLADPAVALLEPVPPLPPPPAPPVPPVSVPPPPPPPA